VQQVKREKISLRTMFCVHARAALRSSTPYRNAFRSLSALATPSRAFTSFHALREDDAQRLPIHEPQKLPIHEPPKLPIHEPPKGMPMNTLFVGNIPWTTNQDELTKLFSPFGQLNDVKIGSPNFSYPILQSLKWR
jgi:hypothetical protein